MQAYQPNLFTRDDTFFGVCQALGDDFRFNPNWLRLALAVPLLWNPMVSFGAYAALAVLVLFSRLVVPNPRVATAAGPEADEASGPTPLERMEQPLAVAA